MTTIANSLGVGSGIDTQALITSLVASQRQAKDDALAARTTKNTARISALGTISNSIDAFSTSLNALIAGGTLFTQPKTSDAGILGVSAIAGARLGDLSASIEVKQLAQSQSIVAAGIASGTTAVGRGTLTLKTASGDYDVTIGAGNDSLTGLAKAINTINVGIVASVITDSSGARLVLKGPTGADQDFTVALKSGDAAGLGRFSYGDPAVAAGAMTLSKDARDAIVVLDGIETTRASNTITDLVEGAKIDLVKAAPGTTVTLGSTRPTDSITTALSDFVGAYNELAAQFATATAAGADAASAGVLRGDRGVTEARRQLSKLTSTPLTATANGPRTLAEIGISTNRDGTLALDAARLSAAMTAYPDAVQAIFNPTQTVDSPFLSITSKIGATKPGTYTLTGITAKTGSTPASGTIAGQPASTGGGGVRLVASLTSPAAGLSILPTADVATATVTVEAGLGGALQAVRDALRATTGVLTVDGNNFSAEAKAIAAEKARVDARSTAYKDQLTASYAQMEARVAAYKATQSYLTQQIALWTNSNN